MYNFIWGGSKNRRILLAIQFFNFLNFFLVILAFCFPKLAFGTSKIEILRSKSVWGQIFMQIRPKFNDFLAIYEFVMIFSRMARCLVFVDPIFCPPPHSLYYIQCMKQYILYIIHYILYIIYYILYYIISYYVILYYIILDFIILYYTILYYIILFYIVFYYTILYYIILCYIILYYIKLYYIILYYIIYYYIILYINMYYYILLYIIIYYYYILYY